MKTKVKKNQMYDFGYFGKWSKETIIQNLVPNIYGSYPPRTLKYVDEKYELEVQELTKLIKKLSSKKVFFKTIGEITQLSEDVKFHSNKLDRIYKDYVKYRKDLNQIYESLVNKYKK